LPREGKIIGGSGNSRCVCGAPVLRSRAQALEYVVGWARIRLRSVLARRSLSGFSRRGGIAIVAW